MAENWLIRHTVDLEKDDGHGLDGGALMLPGDRLGQVWEIEVRKDGAAADLSGGSVTGYFGRSDGQTVVVHGSVSGSLCAVTLTEECCACPGMLRGVMRLTLEGRVLTLADASFRVHQGVGSDLINGGGAVPSLDDLLAQIQRLEAATAAAEAIVDSLKGRMSLGFEERRLSGNLFDRHSALNTLNARLTSAGAELASDAGFNITHYIPVTPGRAYFVEAGFAGVMQRACLYDANLALLSVLEYPASTVFTAPEGAAAMRAVYSAAAEAEVRVEEWAPAGLNLFNAASGFNGDGYYIRYVTPAVGDAFWSRIASDAWGMSHYIPVAAGESYLYYPGGISAVPRVVVYDANLEQLQENGVEAAGNGFRRITSLPEGAAFMRVPYAMRARRGAALVLAGSQAAAYEPYRSAARGPRESVRAYLPDHIYCAVGRTIEIYNGQAVLNPEWYTLRWSCPVGYALGRKFQVTGVEGAVGDYPLTLQVYDRSGQELYSKTATLHIVRDAIPQGKRLLMLGDSLTRANKPVLAELVLLSGEKIVPVGTVTESAEDSSGVRRALSCESRSGWSPLMYASDTAGNPFYDNGFSWAHYTEAHPTVQPDFVTVFLGTNGLGENAAQQAARIKALVSAIRAADADLPVFVANTIYRSCQDGIGADAGSDGYDGGSIGPVKRLEDEKVMALMVALDEALADMEGVYPVNVALSMDAEYSFGAQERAVNPRNGDYREFVPGESIHPQACGYSQMADVLYSAYCAVIRS